MGDLLIRNIPESLKQNLFESAQRAGRSLSDEVKRRLQESDESDSEKKEPSKSTYEDLFEVFASIPVEEREEFSRVMDEIEAERKRDVGRPFSVDE